MRTSKWILFIVCLAVPAVIVFNKFMPNHKLQKAHALPPPFVQQLDTSGSAPPSRAPRYISVRMKKPLETLIAGETGSFELEARLKEPESSSEKPPLTLPCTQVTFSP